MAFTFFFRDSQTLETAIDHALPGMLGQSYIHIWDAGCANGPEPYTLAMLLRSRLSDVVFRNARIYATDNEPTGAFGRQVTAAIYPEEQLRRLPVEHFKRYFRPAGDAGFFRVVEELREKVQFSQHDLLSLTPVREGITMIVCKNVLMHFTEDQRCAVLRMFHRSLCEDGLLVMEHTQKVPDALQRLFQQVTACAQVYTKMPVHAAHEMTHSRVSFSSRRGKTWSAGQA